MDDKGFKYFDGGSRLSWNADVTREERYFCQRLFELARGRVPELVELVDSRDDRQASRGSRRLGLLAGGRWELAYEACVYRDLLHLRKRAIEDWARKRTFDLVLFGEREVVVFEAKAQQGFATDQLEDFKLDRNRLRDLLGLDAHLVGIWSSRYTPRRTTEDVFDGALHWKTLASFFGGDAVLGRADAIYRK